MHKGKDLALYLNEHAPEDLARLILAVADGTRAIAHAVRNIGALNLGGSLETTNVQGETVQKLDDFSNNVMMDFCRSSAVCAGYLSEENDHISTLDPNGIFAISIDPLDGSSNIDIAAPVGTIFSVLRRISPEGPVTEADFLQKGDQVVAAGYAIYGSSTILVLSIGNGVQMFSLNTDDNHFYRSHTDVKIPSNGRIYSLNQGNLSKFESVSQQFVDWCISHDKNTARPYSLRYIGAMVGDMHRTFLKGGVFMYPAAKGETKGKLRLLYECIPMAYLTEQAGGKAINGSRRILDIQPTDPHERCAIIIGCRDMVSKYEEFAASAGTE